MTYHQASKYKNTPDGGKKKEGDFFYSESQTMLSRSALVTGIRRRALQKLGKLLKSRAYATVSVSLSPYVKLLLIFMPTSIARNR